MARSGPMATRRGPGRHGREFGRRLGFVDPAGAEAVVPLAFADDYTRTLALA